MEVIVNLSSLEDKGDYYGEEEKEDWPSGGKEVGDGLKVELLNKGKEGLILKRYSDTTLEFHKENFYRKLRLFHRGNYVRDVVQISSVTSAYANENTDLLRDILHATLDHCSANSSPLVVHSSTGRGVTGVFIALFKLRDDFYNSE